MQNAILIAATLLFAAPMVATGIADGAQQGWTRSPVVSVEGRASTDFPEPEPAIVETPDGPEQGVGSKEAPPAQSDDPVQQVPPQPAEPEPEISEPDPPPLVEIPGFPIDPPADSPPPTSEEPAGP